MKKAIEQSQKLLREVAESLDEVTGFLKLNNLRINADPRQAGKTPRTSTPSSTKPRLS